MLFGFGHKENPPRSCSEEDYPIDLGMVQGGYGRIEISNNRAENAIRPFVMGRKAWLFADTKKGATSSAIVYSIVETAKANNLNVYKYLTHIFRKMLGIDFKNNPSLLEELMPWSSKLPDYCRNPQN